MKLVLALDRVGTQGIKIRFADPPTPISGITFVHVRQYLTTCVPIRNQGVQKKRANQRMHQIRHTLAGTSRWYRHICAAHNTCFNATSRILAQALGCIALPLSACILGCRLQNFRKAFIVAIIFDSALQAYTDATMHWILDVNKRMARHVFSDESEFYLLWHYGRIQDWQKRCIRLRDSCIMHRHVDSLRCFGDKFWDAIIFYLNMPNTNS